MSVLRVEHVYQHSQRRGRWTAVLHDPLLSIYSCAYGRRPSSGSGKCTLVPDTMDPQARPSIDAEH